MKPIELLNAKLNEADEKRIELKFNCQVRLEKYNGLTFTVLYHDKPRKKVRVINDETCAWWDVEKGEISEILGPPPTLPEILRLLNLNSTDLVLTSANYMRIEVDGVVLLFPLNKPVSEWSEETIVSLLALLDGRNAT